MVKGMMLAVSHPFDWLHAGSYQDVGLKVGVRSPPKVPIWCGMGMQGENMCVLHFGLL